MTARGKQSQTIREYLATAPQTPFNSRILRLCEKHGIDIDATPWPPHFPEEESKAPRPAPLPPRKTAEVVQLPLWPEPARGTPNSFLRSALFAAIQGKTRKFLDKALLAAQKGYSVKFTGKQLDQSDLDVWEHAVHLARQHPLGNVCVFRANAFLKAIGRSNGKANYVWLDDAITRLVACAVEIRCGSKVFVGSLLSSAPRDEETGVYKLRLDPDTIKLYGATDWTSLEWQQREALKGKPLALWLHGFFATHAQAYPMKVQTLMELSGSGTKTKKHFTAALKRAFADLEAVAGIKATFDGDLVAVEKIPTPAQAKHLTMKKTRQRRPKKVPAAREEIFLQPIGTVLKEKALKALEKLQ